MTVEKIDSIKVKHKRNKHPMAKKYPGTPSMELGTAYRKFLDDLEPDEMADFAEGKLVFEEEIVADFFDALKVGDEVGLALTEGREEFDTTAPAAYVFEVVKLFPGEDKIRVKNVSFRKARGMEYTMNEIDLYFEDISVAYGMGFADVLVRDGKLFGVSEEIETVINFFGETSGSLSGSIDKSSEETEETEEEKTEVSGSV